MEDRKKGTEGWTQAGKLRVKSKNIKIFQEISIMPENVDMVRSFVKACEAIGGKVVRTSSEFVVARCEVRDTIVELNKQDEKYWFDISRPETIIRVHEPFEIKVFKPSYPTDMMALRSGESRALVREDGSILVDLGLLKGKKKV
ncbi:MAG: hypothetical protein DRP14_04310 [Candidatus Aenigmatarchaeota archaeon]|nr:MAG: hypothetical protein DRP14_04310 [Candidatus Aenigmarchaeota archaeon]